MIDKESPTVLEELFMACFPYAFDNNIDKVIKSIYYSKWPKSTYRIVIISVISMILILVGLFIVFPAKF